MCTDTFKRGRLKSLRLRRQGNGKLINDSKLKEEPSVKKWILLEAYQASSNYRIGNQSCWCRRKEAL